MGLFTSLCTKCDAPITWFGDIPAGLNCHACGHLMTNHDLDESFELYRRAYDKVMAHYKLCSKQDMLLKFAHDKYIAHIMNGIFWPEIDATDKLLSKVASVVGVDFIGKDSFHDDEYCAYYAPHDVNYVWNPLESNATAFEVMVASGVSVKVDHDVQIVTVQLPHGQLITEPFGAKSDELDFPEELATRVAIVNAVALMHDNQNSG